MCNKCNRQGKAYRIDKPSITPYLRIDHVSAKVEVPRLEVGDDSGPAAAAGEAVISGLQMVFCSLFGGGLRGRREVRHYVLGRNDLARLERTILRAHGHRPRRFDHGEAIVVGGEEQKLYCNMLYTKMPAWLASRHTKCGENTYEYWKGLRGGNGFSILNNSGKLGLSQAPRKCRKADSC